ncbi:hypothetical protein HDU96_009468 [Phlyctochytrium bullatum]|nr:hypothetical protein HDU96_009468 [Phlyctochytrium bullatum]
MKTELILKNVTAAFLGVNSTMPGVNFSGMKCNGQSVDVNGWLACEHKLYSTVFADDSFGNVSINNPSGDERYPAIGQYRSQHSCPDFFGYGCPQDGRRGESKFCTTITSAEMFAGSDKALSPVYGTGFKIGSMAGVVSEGYSVTESVAQGVISTLTLLSTVGFAYDQSWKFPKQTIVTPTVSKAYGIYVVNPLTRRTSGYMNYYFDSADGDACNTFDAQDRFEKMDRLFSGGVYNFVKGTYRLCESDSFPIPFCIGEGVHWG